MANTMLLEQPAALLPAAAAGAERNKKKGQKGARQAPRTIIQPAKLLHEVLGQDMVDKLVQDFHVPHDTPTLLDRLRDLGLIRIKASGSSSPRSSVEKIPEIQSTAFNKVPLNQILTTTGGGPLAGQAGDFVTPPLAGNHPKRSKNGGNNIFTLGDFAAVDALSTLTDRHGRVSSMGILDGSYSFFITRSLDAALCFKVLDNICLVGGDPLCPPSLYTYLLSEFAIYRHAHSWGIIFIGASDSFLSYALEQKKRWTSIQFGIERVLNPVTNPVLLEQGKTAKRIVSQNRQLLNPAKGGIRIRVYNPTVYRDTGLQEKLRAIYEAWRQERNASKKGQAFITVYDPFAILGLMTFVYAVGKDDTPLGFAALRRIGANNGFHVDPCIAMLGAPRGLTDLLIFASLSLLNLSGCNYLTFGYEPLMESGRMEGMPAWVENIAKKTHRYVYKGVNVGGKKGYHDKWGPDEDLSGGLHIVFPNGVPGAQDIVSVLHFANISLRSMLKQKLGKFLSSKWRKHGKTCRKETQHEKQARTSKEKATKGSKELASSKENTNLEHHETEKDQTSIKTRDLVETSSTILGDTSSEATLAHTSTPPTIPVNTSGV